jgi:hypothetical protein
VKTNGRPHLVRLSNKVIIILFFYFWPSFQYTDNVAVIIWSCRNKYTFFNKVSPVAWKLDKALKTRARSITEFQWLLPFPNETHQCPDWDRAKFLQFWPSKTMMSLFNWWFVSCYCNVVKTWLFPMAGFIELNYFIR